MKAHQKMIHAIIMILFPSWKARIRVIIIELPAQLLTTNQQICIIFSIIYSLTNINMKNDKIRNHQTLSAKPGSSSTAVTLQHLSKEIEQIEEAAKKESAAEAAKSRCRVCFKEIYPVRRCFGHGGGGGGGGSSDSDKTEANIVFKDDKSWIEAVKTDENLDKLPDELILMKDIEKYDFFAESFDPEIIAELIVAGLLVIDNNRELMTLTLKFTRELNALTARQKAELKKFMEWIVREFNIFKEENHLSSDCMEIILDKNENIVSLRITISALTLYDEFIHRLTAKLALIPNPKSDEKDEVMKDLVSNSLEPNFNPSPFKMNPW